MGSVAGEYRQRVPGASPLYALMEDRFEKFEDVYDDRHADRHGVWRPRVETVVDRRFDCGDPREGFALIRRA